MERSTAAVMPGRSSPEQESWKTDLQQLLSPRSIAVVGASEKPGPGGTTIRFLQDIGFSGDVYPIHPTYERVYGLPCYRDLAQLPQIPDLVVISIRAALVSHTLEQCGELGCRAVTIYTSGFSEMGNEGALLQQELSAIAERYHIRLCGPNCLGHMDVVHKTGAYSGSIMEGTKPGNVAILSQSGSMAISMYQAFREQGISHIISCGNQAVLHMSDYLQWLARDSDTKIIATFIEGITNGPDFIEAIRECRRRGKAIVALKIGKSNISKKIAMAHTASMVGSNAVYGEVFKEGNILEVEDIDEMVQTVAALVKTPPLERDGLAILSISGGQCGLIGDIAESLGLTLPEFTPETTGAITSIVPAYINVRNPLDVAGVGSEQQAFADVLRKVVADENIGVTAVIQDAPMGAGPSAVEGYSQVPKAVLEVARETGKPLLLFTGHSSPYDPRIMGDFPESEVPLLQGMRESLQSIRHLIDYYHRANSSEPPPRLLNRAEWNGVRADLIRLRKEGAYVGERDGKRLLARLGLPVTQDTLCTTTEELRAAANNWVGAAVLKIDSPDILHKTDVGGVRLGLQGKDEILSAYEEMLETVKQRAPEAAIDGVMLQEMVPDGVDLIIGVHKDAQFGPVIAFGLGGIYVEIFRDSNIGLVPVGRDRAREMILHSKSYALLKEVRGRPALDIEPLVDIILTISDLMEACGDQIKEIDLNPVRIGLFGVRILDALIGLEETEA